MGRDNRRLWKVRQYHSGVGCQTGTFGLLSDGQIRSGSRRELPLQLRRRRMTKAPSKGSDARHSPILQQERPLGSKADVGLAASAREPSIDSGVVTGRHLAWRADLCVVAQERQPRVIPESGGRPLGEVARCVHRRLGQLADGLLGVGDAVEVATFSRRKFFWCLVCTACLGRLRPTNVHMALPPPRPGRLSPGRASSKGISPHLKVQ